MKAFSIFTRKISIAVLILTAIIFITNPLFSQDSVKKSSPIKEVKVIVRTDVNGKTSKLDTTINIESDMDIAGLKDVMKDFNFDMKGLAGDIEDMIIDIRSMNLPDSAKLDSLNDMVKKIRIGRGHMGKPGHLRIPERSFDYDFEIPDIQGIPEPPSPPPPPDFDENFNFNYGPGFIEKENRRVEKGNSLSDVLGDIPMDMVKSYSIKDTRNGKKIVIELNDNPVIERHEKVIIIREPRDRSEMNHHRKIMKKRSYYHPDGQPQQEQEIERKKL